MTTRPRQLRAPRPLALAATLALSAACTQHHDELKAVQATLDRQLAERMAIADNLNDFRRELDHLDAKLALARGDAEHDPAVKAALDAPTAPAVAPSPPPALPGLPPKGAFEGPDGERLRLRIEDTERRIAELDKIVGEVSRLRQRKAELEAKLAAVDAARAQRAAVDAGL